MKKSVFLFDRREIDMLSKLKVFLSTSIKDIEYEWNKEYRVTARKLLLKKYFTKYNDHSAGKRIADTFIDIYRSMN